ncbi:mRNA surveillance protein pelota [Candidatus Woesearchaeota archaeon]|nr:mRNA surveillance protein pelota [Candidatus Woesearchaeota archaeon]
MRILSKDPKKGEYKVKTETLDDLWYLSHIADPGDLIRGSTVRKIKMGGEDERKTRISKKKVFLEIELEKIEFKDDILRLSGIIKDGPEDLPRGAHHTFNIDENSIITIKKERWLKYQLEKLKEAAAAKQPDILICILDREEALFALSRKKGYDVLNRLKGDVQKKDDNVVAKGGFYEETIKLIEEYVKRYRIENVIIASPAFWKEELMKHIEDTNLKNKITEASCSSVDEGAINEVLKRNEVREVLKKDRISKEVKIVEQLMQEIAKDEKAAYGIKEVEQAANSGAVKMLLISDGYISEMREKEKYSQVDNVMKLVDDMKGEVHIISSEHDSGKKLDGLGGIGAILRYKLEY